MAITTSTQPPSDVLSVVTVSGDPLPSGTHAVDAKVWARNIVEFNPEGNGGYAIHRGLWHSCREVGKGQTGMQQRHYVSPKVVSGFSILCVAFPKPNNHKINTFRVSFVLDNNTIGDLYQDTEVELNIDGTKMMWVMLSTRAEVLYMTHDDIADSLLTGVGYKGNSNTIRNNGRAMTARDDPSKSLADHVYTRLGVYVPDAVKDITESTFHHKSKNSVYLAAALATYVADSKGSPLKIVAMPAAARPQPFTPVRPTPTPVQKGNADIRKVKKPRKKNKKKEYYVDWHDDEEHPKKKTATKMVRLPDDYEYLGDANGVDMFQRGESGKITTVYNIVNSLNEKTKNIDAWVKAFENQVEEIENLLQTARIATEAAKGIAKDAEKNKKK